MLLVQPLISVFFLSQCDLRLKDHEFQLSTGTFDPGVWPRSEMSSPILFKWLVLQAVHALSKHCGNDQGSQELAVQSLYLEQTNKLGDGETGWRL